MNTLRMEEKVDIESCKKIYELRHQYGVNIDNLCRRFGINKTTVFRRLKKYEEYLKNGK